MPQQDYSTNTREKVRLTPPHDYVVVMHNDDFTTMEFVVNVLMTVFFATREKATQLMLTVHKKGKAEVGRYSYDVAQSKANKAMSMAREEGFPFRLTVEPAEEDMLPF